MTEWYMRKQLCLMPDLMYAPSRIALPHNRRILVGRCEAIEFAPVSGSAVSRYSQLLHVPIPQRLCSAYFLLFLAFQAASCTMWVWYMNVDCCTVFAATPQRRIECNEHPRISLVEHY